MSPERMLSWFKDLASCMPWSTSFLTARNSTGTLLPYVTISLSAQEESSYLERAFSPAQENENCDSQQKAELVTEMTFSDRYQTCGLNAYGGFANSSVLP